MSFDFAMLISKCGDSPNSPKELQQDFDDKPKVRMITTTHSYRETHVWTEGLYFA